MLVGQRFANKVRRDGITAPQIHVGRVATHWSGVGFVVNLPDGTTCYGEGGRGLTKTEAEELLDRIDAWRENNQTGHAVDRGAAPIRSRDVEQASYAGPLN